MPFHVSDLRHGVSGYRPGTRTEAHGTATQAWSTDRSPESMNSYNTSPPPFPNFHPLESDPWRTVRSNQPHLEVWIPWLAKPSPDGLIAELLWGFLGHKVNARSVNRSIITHIISWLTWHLDMGTMLEVTRGEEVGF